MADLPEELVALVKGVGLAAQSGKQRHRAIGHEEIEPPVEVIIQPTDTKSGRQKGRLRQPQVDGRVFKKGFAPPAEVAVERAPLAGQVGDQDVDIAVPVEVLGGNAHARARHSIRGIGCPRDQSSLGEGSIPLVEPEVVGCTIVGDVEVDPPVLIEVAADDPERWSGDFADPRFDGHVTKAPVSLIAEELVRDRTVGRWGTIVSLSGWREALLVSLDGEVDILADVEVQVPIAVIVEKDRARAPAGIADARGGGDITKRPISVVAQQHLSVKARQVEIDVPVRVVVSRRHAHAVVVEPRAARLRHVGEAECSPGDQLVAVEFVARGPATRGREEPHRVPFGRREPAPLQEVDVEVAIAVEIEEGHARPHDLGQVELPRRTGLVIEAQAARYGNLLEERLRDTVSLRWRLPGGEACRDCPRQYRSDQEEKTGGEGYAQASPVAGKVLPGPTSLLK